MPGHRPVRPVGSRGGSPADPGWHIARRLAGGPDTACLRTWPACGSPAGPALSALEELEPARAGSCRGGRVTNRRRLASARGRTGGPGPSPGCSPPAAGQTLLAGGPGMLAARRAGAGGPCTQAGPDPATPVGSGHGRARHTEPARGPADLILTRSERVTWDGATSRVYSLGSSASVTVVGH